MGLLLVYLSISLVFSFLCSLLEASLLSITPSYVRRMNRENPELGKDLNNFKDNIDRPLAAILTLNTFAHTIGAAGVGAQAQLIWGEDALTIVSVALTIVILVATEIIPKTIGANYWERLTPFTVKILKVLIYSPLYPVILFSQFITKRLKQDKTKSVLSRADFTAMAEQGEQEGVLHKTESRLINNVLRFSQIRTQDVMTPRTVLKAMPENQLIEAFHEQAGNLPFSRIPVYAETIDNITGYVLRIDVLECLLQQQGHLPLTEVKRPVKVVHENLPLPKLFTNLMDTKEHIALVADEYGGTAGVVTMEDVIETLLGLEIMDESDQVEDLRKWAKEKGRQRTRPAGGPDKTNS